MWEQRRGHGKQVTAAALYLQGMPTLDGGDTVLRRHGDEVERLPGGYYVALGRCDDTMNLGGIKVASWKKTHAAGWLMIWNTCKAQNLLRGTSWGSVVDVTTNNARSPAQ